MTTDIIKSLKEFIWDIIGYLIPGFSLIIALNFVINPIVSVNNDFLINWKIFGDYLIIVISYVLGFAVYSVSSFKTNSQDFVIGKIDNRYIKWESKRSNENKIFYRWTTKKANRIKLFEKYVKSKKSFFWEDKFMKSATVDSVKGILLDKGYENTDKMSLREMRNILMSNNPSMDDKIYTFRFRSDFFDHISTIMSLIFLLFLIQSIINVMGFDCYFLKLENTFIVLYFIFILLVPLLGNSKRMFHSISQRIPFSNFK